MDETAKDSNQFKRILLSRNSPVALVVGAATFLGSHLVDRLLEKGIQVVGVDSLEYGKRFNLSKASENKHFHLIIEKTKDLSFDLERLDYIFVTTPKEINLDSILEQFKEKKSRLLFVSSIDLYSEEIPTSLKWLKKAETQIAQFANEHHLNARILRLGPVYGPRMNFSKTDPMSKLIQSSLEGSLQKEMALDFSSRALYVDDAVELLIKCLFAGATSLKIFDGVLETPIKVSEIKQILLDPIWHENRGFKPEELPPWPTPNLEKTIKVLHWHPKSDLVESLKKTLSYFKDNEIKPEEEADDLPKATEEEQWKIKKAEELEGLKEGNRQQVTGNSKQKDQELKKIGERKKFPNLYPRIILFVALAIIAFGLILPALELSWGVLTFKYQLTAAVNHLQKGEFDQSLASVQQAQSGVGVADQIFSSLDPLRKTHFLNSQFALGDSFVTLSTLSVDCAKNTILGVQQLYLAIRSVTGELQDDPNLYFDQAKVYLASSDQDLSKAFALINSPDFKSQVPGFLKPNISSLQDKLNNYSKLVQKARALSILLPEAIGKGDKNYLVLLLNNNELRPGGGFIGSFAKVSFSGGKLKKLAVNDTYAIDGQLTGHVEPPKEIKQILGQKDFFLRDSNWEPDFPTSARQAEWFYNKETGEQVSGVVALDISAVADFLRVVGPVELADYNNEKITSDNLFEQAITHAEVGFFPGSQAKKSFLTSLTQGLLNQLFFLPNQNWPGIVSSLGGSIDERHVSVYLDDPTLFSYLVSQDWAGLMPRPSALPSDQLQDFLAPVEANLGANKANYYLDRSLSLATTVGKDGEIKQTLRIAYINRSPSDTFPAGIYKNAMRVYVPIGSTLQSASWGEKDLTPDITNFTDYGRLGLDFYLELAPKEQKTLTVTYQLPNKLTFIGNTAKYRLDVIKQAGTIKDPFTWQITYPLNMKLLSSDQGQIAPQEQTIQTDLSVNRSFEVTLTK